MEVMFDSLNIYDSLEVLSERTPQELIKSIKKIRTPIKIINIVAANNRYIAFIVGDIRKIKKNKKGELNNGS